MQLPRPRFTMRQMLIAVALVAVLTIPLAEESHRRRRPAYHAQQELLSEQKAAELFRKGQAANAAGRSQEATESFRSYNYWNERARGHLQSERPVKSGAMGILAPTSLPQKGVGPGHVAARQGWVGLDEIVDIVVPAVAVALLQYRLEIQQHITIRRPQGDRYHRQPFPERRLVDRNLVGPRGSPDTHLIGRAMRWRNLTRRYHEHPVAPAQEVDLDRVDPGPLHVLPLLQKQPLNFSRAFVGRAEELDGRDDPMALLDVDDLEIALGDRLDVQMDHDGISRKRAAIARLAGGGRLGHGGCGPG
jgi:hypothetical protein